MIRLSDRQTSWHTKSNDKHIQGCARPPQCPILRKQGRDTMRGRIPARALKGYCFMMVKQQDTRQSPVGTLCYCSHPQKCAFLPVSTTSLATELPHVSDWISTYHSRDKSSTKFKQSIKSRDQVKLQQILRHPSTGQPMLQVKLKYLLKAN